jgi:hypothetical protein
MTTTHPRRYRWLALAGASAALTLAVGATPAGAIESRSLTPDTLERRYMACVDGAPTTPDSRERWVASCRETVQRSNFA